MEMGHWVTVSMGHLGHLSRLGHWVIIVTRCETRVFPVFEKCQKCAMSHNYGTNIAFPGTMQILFLAPDINTLIYLLTLSSTRVLDKILDREREQ